jgi:hypothetical protein
MPMTEKDGKPKVQGWSILKRTKKGIDATFNALGTLFGPGSDATKRKLVLMASLIAMPPEKKPKASHLFFFFKTRNSHANLHLFRTH